MCLIVVAFEAHPEYSLVVAANRDESFARPTDPAHFWGGTPDLLAGRDRQAGGTWLGLTRAGRFGAVTNFRDPAQFGREARSRGDLLREALLANTPPADFFRERAAEGAEYNGFNILTVDLGSPGANLVYFTNSDAHAPEGRVDVLGPGVYGISNALLDTPWPKVRRAKAGLATLIEREANAPERLLDGLLELMGDTTRAPDAELPDTGVGLEFERLLAPIFIPGDRYGTRSTTVLAVRRSGAVLFRERAWGPGHVAGPLVDVAFQLDERR